jgi:hypothetical protein
MGGVPTGNCDVAMVLVADDVERPFSNNVLAQPGRSNALGLG